MYKPLILSLALFLPPIPPHSEEISASQAQTISQHAHQEIEIPNGLGEYKRLDKVKAYVFQSIYSNASRGYYHTTIAHPEMKYLSEWGRDMLYTQLIDLGYSVEFDVLNPIVLRIRWD